MSSYLTLEDLEEIKALSGFTESEVFLLEKKFHALNPDKGQISIAGFLRLPELNMPLSHRIPRALGISRLPGLDLKLFCKALALFHPKAAIEDKTDFLFKLYDADGDGMLSREDLTGTLTAIAGRAADEDPALIGYTVDKVFTELGDDGTGKLSRDDFVHGIASVELVKFISFNLDQDT